MSSEQVTVEIVPYHRFRGDWLLRPNCGAPSGLWYRDREHAVSYAEWIARELDWAEIRIYNPAGGLAERRVIDNTGNRGVQT